MSPHLPPDACALPALKARFRRIADAQAWVEERLGPPPRKPTWAMLEQTFRSGAWPAAAKGTVKATGLTAAELDQRLEAMEQRLQQRLGSLEALLARVLETALKA